MVSTNSTKRINHCTIGKLLIHTLPLWHNFRNLKNFIKEPSYAQSINEINKSGTVYGQVLFNLHCLPKLAH
uniref:Uncharacterized protein n=1 Tax=Rhizophora mucronata TaxID=61149 RepID=A0A2P2IJ25_RHIMU